MAAYDGQNGVSLDVVYVDEHLMELEARLSAGLWSGVARAYTDSGAAAIHTLSSDLIRFVDGLAGTVCFEAGAKNGAGFLSLRFYTIDAAGHTACHVQFATQTATDHRPEQMATLALELATEPSFIARFAQELADLAKSRSGNATLVIE